MPIHHLKWTDAAPACLTGGAVTFGNFDGVHRGHQKLLAVLKRWAGKVNGPAVAVTFDPPPVALLNPTALKAPLTTIAKRAELLHAAGADEVVVLQVDASLLALSAPAFIEDVIQKQLAAKAIVEGSNFRFGHNREGDVGTLAKLGIPFESVPVDQISSSKVRAALDSGNVDLARELLGRPYSLEGIVIEGAKRGRTIGVPTANLDQVRTVVPAPGVYAVLARHNGASYSAAANVGPNPTFGDDARKIEVHLLDFEGHLYGHSLDVAVVQKLRDVQAFASVEALQSQVQKDLARARTTLMRERVETLLKTEIAPALELDGSQLEVVAVEDGIASVRLGAICASCPGSVTLVVQQLEAELKARLPEIDILEAVL